MHAPPEIQTFNPFQREHRSLDPAKFA